MEHISDDHYLAPFQAAQFVLNGIQVQQGLGGVGMESVTGVDDADFIQLLGQQVGRTRVGVAYHDGVHAHGLDGQPGVEERLTFLGAASR